jgi:hypothetical protein
MASVTVRKGMRRSSSTSPCGTWWPSRNPVLANWRICSSVGGLRVVPHPAVMLILEFGASPSTVEDGAGRRHRGCLVAGPGFGSGGGVRAWGDHVECVRVRLSPVVAGAVLGAGPADLAGSLVSLDVWGREAARVREQLGEIASWEDRFAFTDALLARRLEARSPVDPAVARAWNRIAVSGGLVRVDHLAAELGWSRKRPWSRFRSHIGVPRKAPRNWSASTMPCTVWSRVRKQPTSRRTAATTTSPICTGTSWRHRHNPGDRTGRAIPDGGRPRMADRGTPAQGSLRATSRVWKRSRPGAVGRDGGHTRRVLSLGKGEGCGRARVAVRPAVVDRDRTDR